MTAMLWPFDDEVAFWQWAMDADAELADQDEDLLLHAAAGLRLLVAAADRPDCPKQRYCGFILDDYALEIVHGPDVAAFALLRDAAAFAADCVDPLPRRWAAYVERLFDYRQPQGPVKRALAERMAADLLSGPSAQEKQIESGHRDWIQVQVSAAGKHWWCRTRDVYPRFLFINRRTGAWRRSFIRPLPAEELRRL